MEDIPVLIISGTMGAGKTTLLFEASDILTHHQIAHAAIDLDALGVAFDPAQPTLSYDLMIKNLASVWQNYAAAGIARVLIARAVDNAKEIEDIRRVIPGSQIVVGRLRVDLSIAERRVGARDCGMLQEQFVARVRVLDGLLDQARIDTFEVVNDGSITVAATEFLRGAGWLA
jgi:hypothetical protein